VIVLHRFNGLEVVVNAELIELLEPGPQTVVQLSTGNKVLVLEKPEEITAKVVAYRKSIDR
jgi:flagellar protein FlbD